MEIASFRDMYIAELQELRNAEGQLAEALPQIAEIASNEQLRDALLDCCEQSQLQEQRLDALLRQHDANPREHVDQAMLALVDETDKMLSSTKGTGLRDAALIASLQKIGHYQIAAYGTAAALAGQLDMRDDQKELHLGLEEEREADALLSSIAKDEVNRDAVSP